MRKYLLLSGVLKATAHRRTQTWHPNIRSDIQQTLFYLYLIPLIPRPTWPQLPGLNTGAALSHTPGEAIVVMAPPCTCKLRVPLQSIGSEKRSDSLPQVLRKGGFPPPQVPTGSKGYGGAGSSRGLGLEPGQKVSRQVTGSSALCSEP